MSTNHEPSRGVARLAQTHLLEPSGPAEREAIARLLRAGFGLPAALAAFALLVWSAELEPAP